MSRKIMRLRTSQLMSLAVLLLLLFAVTIHAASALDGFNLTFPRLL